MSFVVLKVATKDKMSRQEKGQSSLTFFDGTGVGLRYAMFVTSSSSSAFFGK